MMNRIHPQTVLSVHHWTDTLFSFTCTRDPSFQFENGQFTLVGIEVEGKLLMRAYSMVSANDEESLEFLSIKVPGGRLTSHLQYIQAGDSVYVGKKPVGTLVIDHLLPGATLWLLATGTGLAPFLSIIGCPYLSALPAHHTDAYVPARRRAGVSGIYHANLAATGCARPMGAGKAGLLPERDAGALYPSRANDRFD